MKSKNCYFSKGVNPWVWSKIGNISIFLFKPKKWQKNVFDDIIERKNTFLETKNKKLIKSKYWYFQKRASPWVWSKISNFSIFLFYLKKWRENVFDDILERENTFLDNKNNKIIKPKNLFFSKGVSPYVWSKIANFSYFYFSQKMTEKRVW